MDGLRPTDIFELSHYQHRDLFLGCTYVWEALARLKEYLAAQSLGALLGTISPDAYLVDPDKIYIGEGSVVEPGAYIKGPCYIGKGCTVRHGAYLRGDVLTGDDCVIGHDSEMKHSILLNGSKAAHFAYVGDSILGNDVNLGAGTKCANLRIDKKPVTISYSGQSISTGRKKLGALLGDATQTGCNTVINPGTVTGKQVYCYPATVVGGYVPAFHTVKAKGMNVVVPRRQEQNACV